MVPVDDNQPVPSLSDLWQALDQVVRYPESLALSPLLGFLAQAIAPLPLSDQLAIAGLVFDQLAGVVENRATLLIESWESWHRPTDPILDFSNDPDLFVQSQRLELSDLLDTTPDPLFYPFQRKSPTSPDSAFDEAGGEAILEGLLGDMLPGGSDTELPETPTAPLSESEVMASIKSLSHGENIPLWSRQVSQAMRSLSMEQRDQVKGLPLMALQQSLQVPLVEVWLALLLGNSGYTLQRSESPMPESTVALDEATLFYSSELLQVVAVE
ncbi:hypothetical protein H6F86_31050 [Phormidium sp. FACHB-592]|uniref:Uncharacterized protein n=1 Tax=Stenomitos frigidus AS-A4 TaxID=2933935 RepID=A0ABV0KST8_9CYAN|nr:hypothetical protein [Phormidium sp. FACHB-592]MBD2078249.1 hypothetical protein [Phormidium sp. FACHB-592]